MIVENYTFDEVKFCMSYEDLSRFETFFAVTDSLKLKIDHSNIQLYQGTLSGEIKTKIFCLRTLLRITNFLIMIICLIFGFLPRKRFGRSVNDDWK